MNRGISVETIDLSRVFNSKQSKVIALDNVSLSVREGEIFGLLGPNGAGKTTLIRILSTLLLPTSGTARIMGYDVSTQPDKVRKVINLASGAERPGYDFITARANLWFFSQLYGIASNEANRRIDELSDMLELKPYIDSKFYTLSTGYKQRVTIAKAFINDPRVVLLDEPTIGLDVMTAIKIRDFLKRQARDGRTIILATHNMLEADEICDRVAIIDRGRILALDNPSSLKKRYGLPSIVIDLSPPIVRTESILAIEGVKGCTSSTDSDNAISRLKLVIEDESDIEKIIERIAKLGYRVLSFWRKESTLEEVFLALVGRGFREREEELA